MKQIPRRRKKEKKTRTKQAGRPDAWADRAESAHDSTPTSEKKKQACGGRGITHQRYRTHGLTVTAGAAQVPPDPPGYGQLRALALNCRHGLNA
jgi:hypothetical protein